MMKKNNISYVLIVLCFLLAGCGEKYNELITGYGELQMDLTVNTSVKGIGGAESLSLPEPDMEDFTIIAKNKANGSTKTWANMAEFNKGHRKLPVGEYIFTAQNFKTMNDTMYCFQAETEAVIRDAQLTRVSFNCTVAKTLFSANKPDISNSSLKDFALRLKSADDYYKIVESELQGINPGSVRAEITLTNTSGKEVTFSPFSIGKVLRGCHYEIRTEFDKESETLSFIFDEASLAEPVKIKVDDKFFSAESPTIESEGLDECGKQEMFETGEFANPVKAIVSAPGGLRKLLMTVVSDDYMGNPFVTELDLMSCSAQQLSDWGFKTVGLETGSLKAEVDFSDFLSSLPANELSNMHRVVLQAVDGSGRLAEKPLTFDMIVKPISLGMETPELMEIDAKTVVLNVDYNGGRVEEFVTLQHYNGKEWLPLSVEKIEKKDIGKYSFTVTLPVRRTMLVVRAVFKNELKVTEPLILRRLIPDYQVSCKPENVWSSKVDLFVQSEELERLMPYLSVLIRNNAKEEWRPAVIERVLDESRITISTLTPSTYYEIWVTGDGEEGDVIKVMTESALGLENSDFEEVKGSIYIENINCGGKYSNQNSWMPTYNVTTYDVKEPIGWSSVNAKTCSSYARNANTWFKIPSTDVVHGGHKGSAYCVRLRNVGWDLNGIDPVRDARMDEEYFSRNIPRIANHSAGKLFLGSYEFHADGTEKYNPGISFTSRPTAVSGYYCYTRSIYDDNEYGYVHIQIIAKDGDKFIEIGEGKGFLPPSTSFTTFNVPIHYTIRNKKAVALRLMVASSNHASDSQQEETASILTVDYPREGMSLGAELKVDEITLRYE